MYCTKKGRITAKGHQKKHLYLSYFKKSFYNMIEYHLKPASIGVWNGWHNAHIHTNEKRK